VVESLSMELFKKRIAVTLSDVVGTGWWLDLLILVVFPTLMIL